MTTRMLKGRVRIVCDDMAAAHWTLLAKIELERDGYYGARTSARKRWRRWCPGSRLRK